MVRRTRSGTASGLRVVAAMSGGVDSSVAAALLVAQGYQVIGVMMRLWAEDAQAVDDARRVAAQLGIPFHLVNYEAEFKADVVDYFLAEYSRGRTPNPCLACNRQIRFGRLLRHAQMALDAEYLATGHYARVDFHGGCYRLRMGADPQKDQSYVLYMLGQEELGRVLFPVGDYTKEQVRQMAHDWGLPVADRDESMELCFVADGPGTATGLRPGTASGLRPGTASGLRPGTASGLRDYRRFLRERVPQAVQPGPILDTAGREIGQHQGLPFYTVGQRRGLGIAAPEALYVIRLDVARNALIVGPARELGRRSLSAEEVSYVSGEPPAGPVRVRAKIRYKAALADATWTPLGRDDPEGRGDPPGTASGFHAPTAGKHGNHNRAKVEFDAPLRDITPGQAVVAYQGDLVLGGGIISPETASGLCPGTATGLGE